MRKGRGIALTLVFLAAFLVATIDGAAAAKEPSLKKGEPPPGAAANMPDWTARVILGLELHNDHGLTSIRQGWDWFTFTFAPDASTQGNDSPGAGVGHELLSTEPHFIKLEDITEPHFIRYEDISDYVNVIEYRGEYAVRNGSRREKSSLDSYRVGIRRTRAIDLVLDWTTQSDAQQFADALNRLAYSAHLGTLHSNDQSAFLQFQQRAAAWRQLANKPILPAEAERYRVLAENAFQEKRIEDSVVYFDQGLMVFDMWSDAWSNAALMYGELNEYWEAADHIKHYLELAPDAPDAKTAREQLIIWEEKAKTEAQPPSETPTTPQKGLGGYGGGGHAAKP